ncbi:MAG: class I SAM-dependent methyltransferase [Bacteroidetes bacterium]|nr:class I SAM-dependent methyltransferase [Bacteroidota bacterium]
MADNTHIHPDQKFWDERYNSNVTVYGELPNAFFKQQLDLLTPGRILLPADGEGRNSIYAAQKGWKVEAFDFSEEGRRKTLVRAEKLSLNVDYQIADFATVALKQTFYDAIALIFAHMNSRLRKEFHQKCIQALKPGGTLIFEAYTPRQLELNSGGPKDPDYLCTPELLSEEFKGLHLKMNSIVETVLDEGPFHKGLASVVRLVGTRP